MLQKFACTQYGTAVDHTAHTARVQFRAHDRIVRFVISLPDPNTRGWEQKERQRWRQLLLVIRAKLESVTYHISTFEEEFLAHIVLPGDRTVGDMVTPLLAETYRTGQLPTSFKALAAHTEND